MTDLERLYLMEHYPSCVFSRDKAYRAFHARDVRAEFWATVANIRGDVEFVVPLCPECYEGYKDLMIKTYGVKV